jgi:hypothetical protein
MCATLLEPICLFNWEKKIVGVNLVVVTDGENKKVLVLAVIAWCVKRCSHIVSLLLIFIVGMKAGVLYAVYSKRKVFLFLQLLQCS